MIEFDGPNMIECNYQIISTDSPVHASNSLALEIRNWCIDNLQHGFYFVPNPEGYLHLSNFELEDDMILFKLTWGDLL